MHSRTLKILRCKHRKICEVCLAIFQNCAWKGSSMTFQCSPLILSIILQKLLLSLMLSKRSKCEKFKLDRFSSF